MKNCLTASTLLLWIMLLCHQRTAALYLMAAACIWMLWKFRRWLWILCFAVTGSLCILRMEKTVSLPEPGIYTVEKVSSSTLTARRGSCQVVVYHLEEAGLGDQIRLDNFSEVSSLHNFGQFSWSGYLEKNGIQYAAGQAEVVSKGTTMASRIYRLFLQDSSGLLPALFYHIQSDEDSLLPVWMESLGFAGCSLVVFIRKRLERHLSKHWLLAAEVLLGVFLEWIFPFSIPLFRMLFFRVCACIFKDWQTRWSLSVLGFLTVFPDQADALCFVLPVLLSLVCQFQTGRLCQKAASFFCLAGLQFVYFGQCSLPLLFVFGGLRTVYGALCLVSPLVLILPQAGTALTAVLSVLDVSIDALSIDLVPAGWMKLLFFGILLGLLFYPSKKPLMHAAFVLACTPFLWKLDPFFRVTVLDVGQGDAIVVQAPFGRGAVMIDAAGNMNRDLAEDVIAPFLKGRQIHQLQALIVTHEDFDHAGSVEALANRPDLEVVQTVRREADLTRPLPFFHRFLCENRQAADENDSSLISVVGYDSFTWLFMGDASTHVEEQILKQHDIHADVLKLGHHGSDTSSSSAFLEMVRPELGIISSGKNNRYSHPSPKVLERLNQAGIDWLNTAEHGALEIKSLPGLLFMESADGLISLILVHTPLTG